MTDPDLLAPLAHREARAWLEGYAEGSGGCVVPPVWDDLDALAQGLRVATARSVLLLALGARGVAAGLGWTGETARWQDDYCERFARAVREIGRM